MSWTKPWIFLRIHFRIFEFFPRRRAPTLLTYSISSYRPCLNSLPKNSVHLYCISVHNWDTVNIQFKLMFCLAGRGERGGRPRNHHRGGIHYSKCTKQTRRKVNEAVVDPLNFDLDPDPRIRFVKERIRIWTRIRKITFFSKKFRSKKYCFNIWFFLLFMCLVFMCIVYQTKKLFPFFKEICFLVILVYFYVNFPDFLLLWKKSVIKNIKSIILVY